MGRPTETIKRGVKFRSVVSKKSRQGHTFKYYQHHHLALQPYVGLGLLCYSPPQVSILSFPSPSFNLQSPSLVGPLERRLNTIQIIICIVESQLTTARFATPAVCDICNRKRAPRRGIKSHKHQQHSSKKSPSLQSQQFQLTPPPPISSPLLLKF
jgi:hypothetical protein